MPKLILHIGTHKTGTTTIQRFAARNRAALEERGVFYPGYNLIGRKSQYGHHALAKALADLGGGLSLEQAVEFFSVLRPLVAEHPTTLISAEPFYRCALPVAGSELSRQEKYRSGRAAYIDRIKDAIGDVPVQVLLVVRNPATYAQSLYQEHVKVTRYRGTFEEFLEFGWHHFTYLEQAEAWARAFPDVRVAVFEDLKSDRALVRNFYAMLGADTKGLKAQPVTNIGMPTDLVILKRRINRMALGKDDHAALVARLEAFGQDHADDIPTRRLFWSSYDDMSAFYQARTGEIEELLRRYPRPDGRHTDPSVLALPDAYGDVIFGDTLDARTAEMAAAWGLDIAVN